MLPPRFVLGWAARRCRSNFGLASTPDNWPAVRWRRASWSSPKRCSLLVPGHLRAPCDRAVRPLMPAKSRPLLRGWRPCRGNKAQTRRQRRQRMAAGPSGPEFAQDLPVAVRGALALLHGQAPIRHHMRHVSRIQARLKHGEPASSWSIRSPSGAGARVLFQYRLRHAARRPAQQGSHVDTQHAF